MNGMYDNVELQIGGVTYPGARVELRELIVDKQRGGRTGTVRALFEPAFTSFCSYDGRNYDEDQQ